LSFLGNFRLFEPLAASSKISVKKMTIKRRTAVKLGGVFFLPTFTLHKQRQNPSILNVGFANDTKCKRSAVKSRSPSGEILTIFAKERRSPSAKPILLYVSNCKNRNTQSQ